MFEVIKTANSSKARLGLLKINGFEIQTPVFMPVGTYGMIRTLTPDDIKEIGY